MKSKPRPVYHILLFIFIQVAWFSILGLWIARFVTNNIIFRHIGEQYSIHVESGGAIAVFVIGLVLLLAVYVMISLIFRRLSVHSQLNQLYDKFIASVTHELKTPLASIQLYLDTLRKKEITDEQRIHFITLMQQDTERLYQLINTILDIASLEKRKTIFRCSVSHPDDLIRNICREINKKRAPSKAHIEVEGKTDARCVMDPDAFRIVFDNLIDNSIKYSENTATIRIRLSTQKREYCIDYYDDGIGLPPGEHKKIFTKFYRIPLSGRLSVKGTGLGLYWVREIIRYHGGHISAASPGTDRGTHFQITLPIYPLRKRKYLDKIANLTQR